MEGDDGYMDDELTQAFRRGVLGKKQVGGGGEDEVCVKVFHSHDFDESLTSSERYLLQQKLSVEYTGKVNELVSNRIWHYEPFKFKIITESSISSSRGSTKGHSSAEMKKATRNFVGAKTQIKDNIEDEWYMVSLILQLSKLCPDTVISIQDSDGEFLLIEAAKYLPNWLRPESSKNRVFIRQGFIHIIPLPQTPGDVLKYPAACPTLKQAISLILNANIKTRASLPVQRAIKNRVKEVVDKDIDHYVNCYLPPSVAKILDECPQLISYAVDAYCTRDPIDIRDMKRLKYILQTFKQPEKNNAQSNYCYSRIKFTQYLYAKLRQQPCSGDVERVTLCENGKLTPKYKKAIEMGSKLKYGFEILCCRCRDKDMEQNIKQDEGRYKAYIDALNKSGYFRNELVGSKLYRELLQRARVYYEETPVSIDLSFQKGIMREEDDEERDMLPSIGSRIIYMLDQFASNSNLNPKASCFSSDLTTLPADSSDEWMHISPEELQRMWMERMNDDDVNPNPDTDLNPNSSNPKDPQQHHQPIDLAAQMTENMSSFMKQVSDYEGVDNIKGSDNGGGVGDVTIDMDGIEKQFYKLLGLGSDGAEVRLDNDFSGAHLEEELLSDSDILINDESDTDVTNDEHANIDDHRMHAYMEGMDQELGGYDDIAKSFSKAKETIDGDDVDANEDVNTEKDSKELDINFNMVKNFLDSYSSQDGSAGPVGNLLTSMGMYVPKDQPDV